MSYDGLAERALFKPLLTWLGRQRRIRFDTLVVEELPWHGRRVDVATLTATRRTTSYELKLGSNRRAIEQAAYNALSFDKSYIVTATPPSDANAGLAEQLGVGIILIDLAAGRVRIALEPEAQLVSTPVRHRLLAALRDRGMELQHHV